MMHYVFNLLLVGIPGWVVFSHVQAQSTLPNNLDSVREVLTFIASILLAAAVNYVRNRSLEVKKAKAELPSAQQVKDIKDENIIIKADIAVLTESLERVRKERDQAVSDAASLQKLLADTKKLLEEERSTNAELARVNQELQEKFDQLNAEFQVMKATNSAVDKFAVSLITAVEQKLNLLGIQGESK